MLIHETVATADKNSPSIKRTYAARTTRSRTRSLAEAMWFAIWKTCVQCVRGVRWSRLALTVNRERKALALLSDDQLQDIGLSRAEICRETNRHWTDLPRSRLQGDDW